jgi:hypothetical protein
MRQGVASHWGKNGQKSFEKGNEADGQLIKGV